jgi:hypothetical protein
MTKHDLFLMLLLTAVFLITAIKAARRDANYYLAAMLAAIPATAWAAFFLGRP